MSEIERLAMRCKGEVSITFNPQTVSYETVEQYLGTKAGIPADFKYLVEIQFYPLTPVGFEVVQGFDLTAAVAEAHAVLDKRGMP